MAAACEAVVKREHFTSRKCLKTVKVLIIEGGYSCLARDWERSGLLEENPQSGCSDICASLKGPL
jgi:hypothetical protein